MCGFALSLIGDSLSVLVPVRRRTGAQTYKRTGVQTDISLASAFACTKHRFHLNGDGDGDGDGDVVISHSGVQ